MCSSTDASPPPTGDCARLEADVVSYSFIVSDLYCTDYSLPVSRRALRKIRDYSLSVSRRTAKDSVRHPAPLSPNKPSGQIIR